MTYIPTTAGYGGGIHIGPMVSFFRAHKALSESTAIEMTSLDWAETGLLTDPTQTRFGTIYKKMIKKTSEGKYWLDVNGIDEYLRSTRKQFKYIFVIGGALLVACGIFGVLYAANGGDTGDAMAGLSFLFFGGIGLTMGLLVKFP